MIAAIRGVAIALALLVLGGSVAAQLPTRDISVDAMRTERRVALVIGNAAYPAAGLRNPVNDAHAMTVTLKGLGFEVLAHENLDEKAMRRAIDAFGLRLRGSAVGFFYYSGHGLQVRGRNYLVPVDAQLVDENDSEYEAVDVGRVLGKMESAQNRLNIVVLDACRNNPFEKSWSRAGGDSRGLAQMTAPNGTFIAYATAPGSVASDGTGANSVYTAELLKAIRTPGLTLEGVFKRTGAAVAQVTGRAQVPWFSTSVYGEFVFALPMPGALVTPPAVPAPPRVEIREEIGLGTLAVSSRVPGVDVWLDEQKIGTTRTGGTLIVSNLPAGRHRVTARKDGHQAWEREVEVAANQRNEVVIDIAPLVPPILKGDDGTEMVLVPAGEFTMGSNEGEDEKPLRRIYLDAFYIDRHETTNALYRRFVDSTGRATLAHWNDPKLDGASQPVVGVSWHDAATYCRWVGKRLPTEAEWEKAARGTDGRRYPWGEDWNRSLATFLSWQGKTLPVGSHPFGASPYHALDMAGNASEWVADWYEKDYYQRSPSRNPQGPESGTTRVMRGGSFFSVQYSLRTTFRTSYPPGSQFEFAGFRCAKGLQP